MADEKLLLKFECDLMPIDVPLASGNVYTREVLEKVRDQINERSAKYLIMGKPAVMPILIEVVGVLDEAEVTDAHLVVRGAITDHKLIEYIHASDIVITASGYGTATAADIPHTSTLVVGDDYHFLCANVIPADEHHEPNVRWEPCESD